MNLVKQASMGDWGIIATLLCSIVGSFLVYNEAHFAHADSIPAIQLKTDLISQSVNQDRAERMEFQKDMTDKMDTLIEKVGHVEGILDPSSRRR